MFQGIRLAVKEMRQQQRMKVRTEITKNIKSKVRLDANNSWWVSELLAADCKTAWLHPEWEGTMLRWYGWLPEIKKDEEKKMEVEQRTLVSRMIQSSDGSTGLLHKITKPSAWRGGECRFCWKKKMPSQM